MSTDKQFVYYVQAGERTAYGHFKGLQLPEVTAFSEKAQSPGPFLLNIAAIEHLFQPLKAGIKKSKYVYLQESVHIFKG